MRRSLTTLGTAALVAAAAWHTVIRPARLAAAEAERNAAAARQELAIRSQDIAFYERRAAEDPQSAEDRAMVAGLYLQRARETGEVDDYRAAERFARAALDLRRVRNGKALLAYASALLAQHKFPEALTAARELIASEPSEPRYRALYAELLIEMGQYDAAGAQFDSLRNDLRTLAVAPRYARYLEFIGRTEHARSVLRRAVRDMADADLPREQIAWFHLRAADLELRSGRLRVAERALDLGLSAAPRDGRLWAARARLHALRREWRDVLAAVSRAGDRTDIATIALMGDAYAALGDSIKAREAWSEARDMGTENPEPFNRQWTLFKLEHGIDLANTRALLEQEITIRQDVYGWDQLALARYMTNDIAGAAVAMREAMSVGTRDANLLYHAALIARAEGDPSRARSFAQQALELNPHFHHRFVPEARVLASGR
ncbi:MAG TPA: tetratricopeptide repeat protein [Gemmatimonadaceae bacterium]|nr:tetratricopeptide repeat protein [Gemmatimonadaceae bacterium]